MALATLMIEAERAGVFLYVKLVCAEERDASAPFVAMLIEAGGLGRSSTTVITATGICPIEAIAGLSRQADAAHTLLCEAGAL